MVRAYGKGFAGAFLLMAGAALPLSGMAQQAHDHGAMMAEGAKQEATPACPQSPPALPSELAAWQGERAQVKAATSSAKLARATLSPGQAVDATLAPMPKIAFAVRPEKPGGSVSKGGLFRFDIQEAGVYRVALGAGPWIDVIEEGATLPSIAHGHGPDCSGIRKMVDYELKAGLHILQISGNGDAALSLMVVRLR